MNTATFHACAMPSAIARNEQGRATVALADGRCVELDVLRDACRIDAQALRQQAIADSMVALASACRRLCSGLSRPVRSAQAPEAGVRLHRA